LRRRPKLSDRPDVAQHLHDHVEVTRAELDAFLRADDAVRLLVLAELRSRGADQETGLVLTLEAAGLAVAAILLLRVPVLAQPGLSGPWWVQDVTFGIVCLVLGLFAAALVLPSAWRAVRGNRDHQRAVVWLAAYEEAASVRRTKPRTWRWRP
jgi:hypothetical protein